MDATPPFAYETAFSRNLGWLTEWEQQALRGKCVAIAGMGGVGGSHLLTLTRLGVGAFRIADLDRFELVNFNRQAGATVRTIGQPKVSVMAQKALEINPELRITCFDQGVNEDNLDRFLAGADLFVDSLDFFVLPMRRRVSARCRELGIPVINAAPLGMGTAILIFTPDGMSFEEWFRLNGLSEEQQYISYLVGMAPSGLHRGYLVDPSRVDLQGHRGPSTAAACELCAGVASVEAIKLLLGRGEVYAAPYYQHFDAYRGRWVRKKLRWGNSNPVQRAKIAIMRVLAKRWSRSAIGVTEESVGPRSEIERIFDLARWSPSGDNVQPWRFELRGDDEAVVYLSDQSRDDLYDYRHGESTLLAGGALVESARIAATAYGRRLEWQYMGCEGSTHTLRCIFPKSADVVLDRHFADVPLRSVDRRKYRIQSLSEAQKRALEASLGPQFSVSWYEKTAARIRIARLGARATFVRLSTPEAYPVHVRAIDWQRSLSPSGIPARAAGLTLPSTMLMRWAMKSWPRMRLMNKLGGAFLAGIEMDYRPAVFSAAFFAIRYIAQSSDEKSQPAASIEAGQAIQRFWLTATSLGLAMQPTMATLIFAHYGQNEPEFTTDLRVQRRAKDLGTAVQQHLGSQLFLGRIGVPSRREKLYRSVRKPLRELLINTGQARVNA